MSLAEHKFFHAFPATEVERLMQEAEVIELPVGGELFREGDTSDAVYLIYDGQVELTKAAADGSVRIIATPNAGEYFGEMGVFDGSVRSTGARGGGAQATRLARIPSGPLLATLHESPGRSAMAFMHTLLDHLRNSNQRYMNDIVRREKTSLVGEMANGIIHDIRGPFQSVQLASELLLELHQDDETRDICKMIGAQITRVSVMAEELLEFSRGTPRLTFEIIDLAVLMEEFQFLNKDVLRSAKIPVEFTTGSILVQVDRHKMIRTIQNILNNALEVLKDRPESKISITAGPVAEHAEIRLTDNGPGIPEQIRERLFEPFVTHGKKNGTGLGMAIVKSVVEAHHGNIFFETETGVGTTFFIQLPKVLSE